MNATTLSSFGFTRGGYRCTDGNAPNSARRTSRR